MRNTTARARAERETPPPETHRAPHEDGDQAVGWAPQLGELRHVDHRWLRSINRALVLACIRDRGPISRVKIATYTALSRTTVSAIASALLREGVIHEDGRAPSTVRGGRPATLLHTTPHGDSASPARSSNPVE